MQHLRSKRLERILWLLSMTCLAAIGLRLALDSVAVWQTIPARALLQHLRERDNGAPHTYGPTSSGPPLIIHDGREVDLFRRVRLLSTIAAVDGMQGDRSILSWRGRVYCWPAPFRGWGPTEWHQGGLMGPAVICEPTEFRTPLGWTALLFLGMCAVSMASLVCAAAVTLGRRYTFVLLRAWITAENPPRWTSVCLRAIPAYLSIVLLMACVVGTMLWYLEMPRPSLGVVPAPAYQHLWWWPKWSLVTWALCSCVLALNFSRPRYSNLIHGLQQELQMCRNCGYPLPSNVDGAVCPECGPLHLGANGVFKNARLIVVSLVGLACVGFAVELWFVPMRREFYPLFAERPIHTHDGWSNELLGRWWAAEDGVILLLPRDTSADVSFGGDPHTLWVSAKSDSPSEVATRGGPPRIPGVVMSIRLGADTVSQQRTIVTRPFFWDNVRLEDSKGEIIQDPVQAMKIELGGIHIEAWAYSSYEVAVFVQCDTPKRAVVNSSSN